MLFNPYLGQNKGVHTFPKGINLKVNMITWLGMERAYFEVVVKHLIMLSVFHIEYILNQYKYNNMDWRL